MKLKRGYGFLFCLCVFSFMPLTALAHHQVVLVTNTSCPVNTVSSLELRKIYFGIKVRRDNFHIRGMRNLTNDLLDKIFHQTVVAMSSRSYQRRLLAQILDSGRPRISEFSNTEKLLVELRKFPCNVTYMWGKEVVFYKDLKVIKLLWSE